MQEYGEEGEEAQVLRNKIEYAKRINLVEGTEASSRFDTFIVNQIRQGCSVEELYLGMVYRTGSKNTFESNAFFGRHV